jgi:hypothetical protein
MEDLFTPGGAMGLGLPQETGSARDVGALLEVFEARLIGQRSSEWRSLFQGFRRLKAI